MRREAPRPIEPMQPSIWMSVCDLMSSIVFIFLITLTLFLVDFRVQQQSLISAQVSLRSPTLTRQKLLVDLQEILQGEDSQVEVFPREGILRLGEKSVSFPSAKALPEEDKLAHIGKLANALRQILPCFANYTEHELSPDAESLPLWCETITAKAYSCHGKFKGKLESIMVEGHTDGTAMRPGALYKDNLALSAARATTVLRLLRMCTPQLDFLTNTSSQPLFAASGYSSLRPLNRADPNDPKNRRIDIRFVMELPEGAIAGE